MKFEVAVVLFLGTIAEAVPRPMVVSEGNTYLRDLEVRPIMSCLTTCICETVITLIINFR